MSYCPEELKYSLTNEWVSIDPAQKIATIGITDFAQHQLGELIHVELPETGLKITAGDEVCVLESVKTTTEVLSPISGKIVEVNEDLEDSPGLINTDPYQDGWLYKIEIKDQQEYDELLDVEDYEEHLAESEDS